MRQKRVPPGTLLYYPGEPAVDAGTCDAPVIMAICQPLFWRTCREKSTCVESEVKEDQTPCLIEKEHQRHGFTYAGDI